MTELYDNDEIDGTNPNSKTITSSNKGLNYRKILVTLLLIIVLLLITFGVMFIYSKDKTTVSTDNGCNSRDEGSVLYNANKIFKENTVVVTNEQIDSLVEQIMKVDRYENEANCLYPIIYSYIQDGNYQKASDEYANFANAYGSGENFASDIYPMNNIDELKNLIDFSLKNSAITNTTPNGIILLGEPTSVESTEVNQ